MADFTIQQEISRIEQAAALRQRPGTSPLVKNEAKIEQLIVLGEDRRKHGDVETARQAFELILKLDPGNVKATLALCKLTEDPYTARDLLKTMLIFYPGQPEGVEWFNKAEARCKALEEMVTGSAYLHSWEEREKMHQERLRFNRDQRAAPVTKIGKLLLNAKYITEEQLETAVSLQTMLTRFEQHQPLGKVLLDYGYINEVQLEEILKLQENEFLSQMY